MFSHGYGAHSEMGGSFFSFSFFRFYLFIFRERGKEGEREGEEHQCVVAFRASPTGDLAHNPGLCTNWESKRWPFGLQASAQSTEPHQPGFDGGISYLRSLRHIYPSRSSFKRMFPKPAIPEAPCTSYPKPETISPKSDLQKSLFWAIMDSINRMAFFIF